MSWPGPVQHPTAPPTIPARNSTLKSGGKSADGEVLGFFWEAQRFMPFTAGARACPGRAGALAPLLIHNYLWDSEWGVLRPSDRFTVMPMHGVWAHVRPS